MLALAYRSHRLTIGTTGPSAPPRLDPQEIIERVRRKLYGYFEAAAEAVEEKPQQTRSIFSYARYSVGIRKQSLGAVRVLHGAPTDVHERLLRQAEVSYLTHPERFSEVRGRVDLMKAWYRIAIEASEKLAGDEERRESFGGDDGWDDRSPVAQASRRALGPS